MLEDVGFGDICVSMKSSNVPLMMQAYRLMYERSDYPLHVGVTETGTEYMGTIKSAMGIGGLLCLGIGDTIRVSLTADPVREVVAAKAILKAAGLRKQGREPHLLPDVRPHEDRSHWTCQPRAGGPAGLRQGADGRRHGLCCERAGRGARGGISASRAAMAAACCSCTVS